MARGLWAWALILSANMVAAVVSIDLDLPSTKAIHCATENSTTNGIDKNGIHGDIKNNMQGARSTNKYDAVETTIATSNAIFVVDALW